MLKFDEAFAFSLGCEGGYSNHPADAGGATNLGITAATLETAHKWGLAKTAKTVRQLTREDAKAIYKAMYWDTAKCGQMPMPLCVLHFDASVHHGVKSANKILQKAINECGCFLTVDGVIGNITLSSIKAFETKGKLDKLCTAYCDVRQTKFNNIVVKNPSQRVFIKGWTNRVERNRAFANRKLKEGVC